MVGGASGVLLAGALWVGALLVVAADAAPEVTDEVGSLEGAGLQLPRLLHEHGRADARRVEVVVEDEDDGALEDADPAAPDDDVDLRWWLDDLDDDDPAPDPQPDGVPASSDGGDLDEWLAA